MEAEIVVSIAVVTGMVLIINQLGRVIRASILHRTIREAIRRDSSMTPELMRRMEQQQANGGGGDERNGLVLLALGAAIFCYGLIQGNAEAIRDLSGVALFPLSVGAALLIRARLLRRKQDAG